MTMALTGARVFDGSAIVEGHSVIVADGRIAGLVPDADVPSGAAVRRVAGLLAPGFIDVQVNGGGGVLFNDARSAEGIAAIAAAHRPFGTTGIMPTLITDTRAHMAEAIAAARQALENNVPGALGIHIEGPFLSPERKGVHDPKLFRDVEEEDIALVTSLGIGRTLMTLAPERVPPAIVARLVGSRCHPLRRPHRGELRDRGGGPRRRPDRLHPPFQRHAAARRPRAGTGRRRAR